MKFSVALSVFLLAGFPGIAIAQEAGQTIPLSQSPLYGLFVAFLLSSLVIVGGFVYVVRSTGRPQEADMKAAYRLRKKLFYLLVPVLLIFLGVTLTKLPYPADGPRPDRLIHMVAKQFAFAFSETPIANEAEWDKRSSEPPIVIPAGATAEFRVTSWDVNHGFGVYTPDGRILAQTQAMPGYVNRLRVKFDRPGEYPILCLEYCGLAHHAMRGSVVVR